MFVIPIVYCHLLGNWGNWGGRGGLGCDREKAVLLLICHWQGCPTHQSCTFNHPVDNVLVSCDKPHSVSISIYLYLYLYICVCVCVCVCVYLYIYMYICIHNYDVKAMVFPEIMYRYKSWTIKKAEHQIIDAFKLWCWKRLLKFPWTARRSNQSIWKEINLEYLFKGLMLELKLHYFGHLMERADSLRKTLMLGKIDDKRRRGWQRMRWWDSISDSMDVNLSKLQEIVKTKEFSVLQSTGLQRVDMT